MASPTPLFDFSAYRAQRDDILPLIRRFASHDAFRSAAVEELELDEDFHRRPLRPEDLDFLQFKRPVPAERISRLPSLATQRLLMSLNETGIARLPRAADADAFARSDAFYGEQNQVLGARIRPFLEHYGFSFLGSEASHDDGIGTHVDRLVSVIADEKAFWLETFATLSRNDYLHEGLRFIAIQLWSLAPSRHVAVERARVSGYFDAVAVADQPRLAARDPLLESIASIADVTKRAHSYWQFYLPTSLGKCNLLYALGTRPDRAFALLGAAFAAEAEALAFGAAVREACPHLAPRADAATASPIENVAALVGRFERALTTIAASFGGEGVFRAGQGIGAGARMAERARWDLGEQLKWLSSIGRYVAFAHEIDRRIEAECPDIDRETFVEPHDLCSTTHVHNDHRLVVIAEGQMHFWGNLGMRLEMNRGDKVLIPDGRLHGSTVLSGECTYHQPIIPDAWIEEWLQGSKARPEAAVA